MPDIFVSENKPAEKVLQKTNLPNEKQKNSVGVFSSYCVNPHVRYRDLGSDEEILLFLRRHFVTNIPWIFQGLIALIAPFLLGALINMLGVSASGIPANVVFFITLFYYLLVFEFFFLNFLNWFYNISLVTTKRVIDIDFRVLFSKHIAATKIVQIEDVSLNEVGLIRSVFDYGDVKVQTAGTADFFEFLAVPHPEQIVHVIGDLIGKKHVS